MTDGGFLASGQVLKLVGDLISRWCEWETQQQLYLQTTLPQLKAQTLRNSTPEEQNLMRRIKRIASQAEWENLGWIAEHLEAQEKQWWAFSHKLESLLRSGAFDEAENYASRFGNPSLVEWCKAREQDGRKRITERIERLLKAGDLTEAEQTLGTYQSAFDDDQWMDWASRIQEQKKSNHISRARAEIKEALERFDFKVAKHRYTEVTARYSEGAIPEYDEWVTEARRRHLDVTVGRARAGIEQALRSFDFDRAEQLYAEVRERYPEAVIREYEGMVSQARRSQLDAGLREKLEEYDFDEARRLFEDNRALISSEEFDQLVEEYQCKRELSWLSGPLTDFRFADADDQYTVCEHLSREEYEALKAEYIMEYAQSRSFPMPNREQALALASTSRNLLIQARAGSGKTRVAAQKAILLMQDSVGNPDEILILAFNHDAATQIGRRIRQRYRFDQYGNARTFHSLAWWLVCPEEDLLYDDRDRGLPGMELSQFVQDNVIAELMNPVFRERMYAFFREDLVAIEDAGLLLPEDEYYVYRRNLRQRTLRGDVVKSRGEKWIADFLFEHYIWYKYESVYSWDGGLYRPDFWVGSADKDYIIEHWAIDEDHPEALPAWWPKTAEDYLEEMDRKRQYWKDKGIALIETSVADMRAGREQFEMVLRRRLEEHGITCRRLPQEGLYEKVVPIHLSKFAEKATQFI